MKKGDMLDEVLIDLGNQGYAILRSKGASHHEAEDVIQETYYKLIKLLPEIRPEQLKPWFFRVALNHFIDEKRKQTKNQHVSNDFFDHLLQEDNTGLNYKDVDNKDHIEYEFNRVKPEYQEILLLKYYYELSYNEIAEILEIKPNSVKQKLSRARQSVLKERKK
ncbi:MAG: RNA polymerase sigma factor [Vagococcus sp.]|uniref:RNA polymerase sigma factor n=1 Tax=Vagococcus sp. TaxID=1933889 RepID=UPI002FC70A10